MKLKKQEYKLYDFDDSKMVCYGYNITDDEALNIVEKLNNNYPGRYFCYDNFAWDFEGSNNCVTFRERGGHANDVDFDILKTVYVNKDGFILNEIDGESEYTNEEFEKISENLLFEGLI